MRIRLISVAALAAAMALAMGTANAATRSETQPYVGPTGDALVLQCNGTDNIGGACFTLSPGTASGDDVSITNITISDLTTLPVGGYYTFRDIGGLDGNDLGNGTFCNSIDNLAIPAGTALLVVFIDEALGPLDCPGNLGAGTTGTVTVTLNTVD